MVRPATLLAVVPSVTTVLPRVKVEFCKAEFGIAPAVTVSEGVVVEFDTEGTNQVGHDPDGAEKLVTVPVPEPVAQACPVLEITPALLI